MSPSPTPHVASRQVVRVRQHPSSSALCPAKERIREVPDSGEVGNPYHTAIAALKDAPARGLGERQGFGRDIAKLRLAGYRRASSAGRATIVPTCGARAETNSQLLKFSTAAWSCRGAVPSSSRRGVCANSFGGQKRKGRACAFRPFGVVATWPSEETSARGLRCALGQPSSVPRC